MQQQLTRQLSLIAMTTLALSVAACNRHEDKTAGQQLDAAIAKTEQQTQEATDAVKREMAEAKADTAAAADTVEAKAKAAADMVSDKVADAAITANVNAELAKDTQLSALKINVDTNDGHVVLRGTAPSADARERATRLAAAVKGVTGVDNHLDVRG
jgi:osmotically-inducible protein OsmY